MEFVKLLISLVTLAISAADVAIHYREMKNHEKSANENDRQSFDTVTIILVIYRKE